MANSTAFCDNPHARYGGVFIGVMGITGNVRFPIGARNTVRLGHGQGRHHFLGTLLQRSAHTVGTHLLTAPRSPQTGPTRTTMLVSLLIIRFGGSISDSSLVGQAKRALCAAMMTTGGGIGGIIAGNIFQAKDAPAYRTALIICIAFQVSTENLAAHATVDSRFNRLSISC